MSDKELLQILRDQGTIDMYDIEQIVKMRNREKYLEKHPYSVWQDSSGRWFTYLPGDNGKRRRQISRKTQEELHDAIIDYWMDNEENPPIKEVFKAWNDRRLELKKISRSTYERNQATFKRHYDEFGNRKIRDVEMQDFVDFLEEQIPRFDLTAKSFSNLKTVTRGIIKYAKRQKYICYTTTDVMEELDTDVKFRRNVKTDEQEVFTEDEMPRVMNYLCNNKDIVNLGILLSFVTGIRVGELVALKWEDFDQYGFYIRRSETRYYEGKVGHYEIQEHAKSEAGERYVAVPESYRWIITDIRKINPFSEFLFEKNGERLHTYAFRNRMHTVCEKSDCVQKSPHKIRKTYGSILLDNNLDQKLITSQMGHTNISCTENHYHRNRRSNQKRADIIGNLPEFQDCRKAE